MHVRLLVDVAHVGAHSVLRYAEALGDPGLRAAVRQQQADLALARSEACLLYTSDAADEL